MTFATPAALLLLLRVLKVREFRAERPSPALVFAYASILRGAARPTWRLRLCRLPAILRAVAIALVIVASARPREGQTLPPSLGRRRRASSAMG